MVSASTQVETERVVVLSEDEPDADGRFVLYWMQSSMRAEHNPALEFAVQRANDAGVPLVVAAVVVPDYPEASARHFSFMLGGMGQALRAVERRGATVVVVSGDPVECIERVATDAVEVVVDRGYLRHQRSWRRDLVQRVDGRVTQVEGDVVVPVDLVSDHQEHAARTIRPKIRKHLDRFVRDLSTTSIDHRTSVRLGRADLDTIAITDFDDIDALLERLGCSGDGPQPVDWITPGTAAARRALSDFVDRAADYDDDRNRWASADTSMLSPYLHFGQISPVRIAVDLVERHGDDADPAIEELVVRRELAVNFVERCSDYDSWSGLPEWARETLEAHADDERADVFTSAELEAGETDDEVWNAVMAEIRDRGWVHNQLRMYWGKQIVHWTNTPQHAHRTLLELNNRWFLDGRDPSSYANVGWCFGLHDQGFQERAVTGKVRPFTEAALRRKDDLAGWLDRVT